MKKRGDKTRLRDKETRAKITISYNIKHELFVHTSGSFRSLGISLLYNIKYYGHEHVLAKR